MLKVLRARMVQGHRTSAYPIAPPVLPERFKGLPAIDSVKCRPGCTACRDVCPVGAVECTGAGPALDLGLCLFCGMCTDSCPGKALAFTREHRLAARTRADLVVSGTKPLPRAQPLEPARLGLFRRSLCLRQVSAGGCGACEADTNVLNTLVFDLSRFGIQFVASPRHADGLLITGPVSRNMEEALRKTYAATPAPKIVIAVGACAISGGVFAKHAQTRAGVGEILPVDLYIPGCPPHPYTILDGLLRFLARVA